MRKQRVPQQLLMRAMAGLSLGNVGSVPPNGVSVNRASRGIPAYHPEGLSTAAAGSGGSAPNTGRGGPASTPGHPYDPEGEVGLTVMRAWRLPLTRMSVVSKNLQCLHTNSRAFSSRIVTAAGGKLLQLRATAPQQLSSSGFLYGGPACGHRCPARSVVTHASISVAEADAAVGSLVEFRKDARVGLALIQRPDGKRNWVAMDTRGQTYSLRPQQIVYVLPGSGYTEKDLHAMYEQAQVNTDIGLLETAWEVVSEDQDFYNVVQMAEFLYGEVSPATCYSAHRLLNEDRTFFKQVGRMPPVFQARPATEVAKLQAQAAAEKKAAEELAACSAALREALVLPFGKKPSADSWRRGPWAARIAALEARALEVADAQVMDQAADLMKLAGRGTATSAHDAAEVLRGLGVWSPHQHLGPLKAGLTDHFPTDVLNEVEQLKASPPDDLDAERRQDLSHLTAWAVDSADTTEVDDAVSVEFLPEGRRRLWVHVADPTRWLTPGSALDAESRRRTSTLYLPTGSVPMFPKGLAEQVFSLCQGQAGNAISVSVVLDKEGSIAECGVTPSIVHTNRLTYDALDALLPSASHDIQPELYALHQMAQLRREWRQQQGAVDVRMMECEVHVRGPDSVKPEVFLQGSNMHESPARNLVSELMILANQAVATLGHGAGLALPYRGQAAIVMPTAAELAEAPEGPCREVLLRSRMTRSVFTTSGPLLHAGLGLPAYVQFTSPIRRYTDLLAHWQIKAHLRGDPPPWQADSLMEVLDEIAVHHREAVLVTRDVTDYWIAQYFHRAVQTNPYRTWNATLLQWIRRETGMAKVQLTESGLETMVRVNRPAQPGESLTLICSAVDTATAKYQLEERFTPVLQPVVAEGLMDDAAAVDDEEVADDLGELQIDSHESEAREVLC